MHRIILSSPGSHYSIPPTVTVEAPSLLDGSRATARAILSTTPGALGLFAVAEVVLDSGG